MSSTKKRLSICKRSACPKRSSRCFQKSTPSRPHSIREAYLKSLGITTPRHLKIATEGALSASVLSHGVSKELSILSDDAGQFHITGLLHALCGVHAARTIHKIIAFSEAHRAAQNQVRSEIWHFYQALKAFKMAPLAEEKSQLAARFEQIFTQKTCFITLNLALGRLHQNKPELLLVLPRPEIPLHNNLRESDIRDFVKKRKISASTRSENGRRCRDTFLSLKKTCQKLKISFRDFLRDRLWKIADIPPLPHIIRTTPMAPGFNYPDLLRTYKNLAKTYPYKPGSRQSR